MFKNFPRLKLYHRPARNDHLSRWLVRVTTDPLLAHLDLQHAKIPQLHRAGGRQGILNNIKRLLNDIHHLLLGKSCFPIYLQNNFAFR